MLLTQTDAVLDEISAIFPETSVDDMVGVCNLIFTYYTPSTVSIKNCSFEIIPG
jgi:hypothetical protein